MKCRWSFEPPVGRARRKEQSTLQRESPPFRYWLSNAGAETSDTVVQCVPGLRTQCELRKTRFFCRESDVFSRSKHPSEFCTVNDRSADKSEGQYSKPGATPELCTLLVKSVCADYATEKVFDVGIGIDGPHQANVLVGSHDNDCTLIATNATQIKNVPLAWIGTEDFFIVNCPSPVNLGPYYGL